MPGWSRIFLLLLAAALMQLPYLSLLNEKVSDIWVVSAASSHPPDEKIVIIEIDDQSLIRLQPQLGRWPWPRSVYGYLLEGLSQYQPKAILFDVLFTEADLYRPDDDRYFTEMLQQQQQAYLPLVWHQQRDQNDAGLPLAQLPQAIFRARGDNTVTAAIDVPVMLAGLQGRVGAINYQADRDGIGRYYPLWFDIQGWQLYTLPARLVADINPALIDKPARKIRLNFNGTEAVSHRSLSFADAMNLVLQEPDPEVAAFFTDSIVLIGATATGLGDFRHTPVSDRQPGVSILATATDNLLNQDYFIPLPEYFAQILILLVLALLLRWCGKSESYRRYLHLSLLLLGAVISLLTLSAYLLSQHGVLMPFAGSLLILVLFFIGTHFYRGLTEYMQRQHAIRTFGRFMDPKVVGQLVESSDWQRHVRPKDCQITVLFSDIRAFTTLSESRSAQQVMDLLNAYFALQVETIFKYGGTLDKFIGDAIMAFWGAPIADQQQADNAIRAAIEMEQNLFKFRQSLDASLQGFDIGIGVHTGTAMVGVLGSEQRFDYTAIGDTVNLASRIEGLTKEYGRILVSDSTLENCAVSHDISYAGDFHVKGRQGAVKLYKLSRGKE